MGSFFCVFCTVLEESSSCVSLYHEPSALATENVSQLVIETPNRGKVACLSTPIETPIRGNH